MVTRWHCFCHYGNKVTLFLSLCKQGDIVSVTMVTRWHCFCHYDNKVTSFLSLCKQGDIVSVTMVTKTVDLQINVFFLSREEKSLRNSYVNKCSWINFRYWLHMKAHTSLAASYETIVRGPVHVLTLKVLNFWKFTRYCSSKPLWSGMGEVVPARTSPTLHPPSPPTVHQLSWLAL